MFTYRVRGCNAYGCGETSLLLAPASVDVAIPATLPMTPPQAFALAPDTIAPNLPVRFYWQAVPGAESYQLVARDVGCHPGELITVGVPANAVMPYRQPSFIPRCNNQIQDQVTLRYWVKACAAGVCSESSNTQDLYVGIQPRSVETVSETTYIHTDALRSPVAETDASGAVVKRMAYTPWGVPADGIYTQGPGYTGHVTDAATGLSYMQQRYYDPVGARFVSPDPVRPDAESGGNFNRYWYANDNPYKYIDPHGRQVQYAIENSGWMLIPQETAESDNILMSPSAIKQREVITDRALRSVFSTERGRQLRQKVEDSGNKLKINLNDQNHQRSVPGSFELDFDPSRTKPVETTAGKIDASPERIIAHEAGHAITGTGDSGPNRMDNSKQNENPIMKELGQPERVKY